MEWIESFNMLLLEHHAVTAAKRSSKGETKQAGSQFGPLRTRGCSDSSKKVEKCQSDWLCNSKDKLCKYLFELDHYVFGQFHVLEHPF